MAGVKHKHAAVIKEWADGATIEVRCEERDGEYTEWKITQDPQWSNDYEYRVYREPVVQIMLGKLGFREISDSGHSYGHTLDICPGLNNIRAKFVDNVLVSVEVIQ